MKILWLFLFVGIIQCDDKSISPDQYGCLGVPNTVEYISVYTLSVQTSYITSVECMLSSNFYIKSGFSEIDSKTNGIISNLIMSFENGLKSLEEMYSGLEDDQEKEIKKKLDSVLFMTVKYYMKQDITVEESDLSFGSATDATCAKSRLVAQRCESSYSCFMSDIETLKSKYTSETSSTSASESEWASIVKNYYEARTEIDRKTNVYASIRDAFLYGNGINLCQGSANTDGKLLDIYKSDDLSSFFGISGQTDASELFNKTIQHMYKIYKTSLTVIYLHSVAYSDNDLALRIMVWEQLNSIRANFEYKSQNIFVFMQGIQGNAESKLGKNSDEYNQAMEALYKSVHKLLVVIVKTTEVHYQRAWNFDSQDVMKMNYNSYNIDVLTKYYNSILWKNANVGNFDMRMVDNTPFKPSSDMPIPQNMYSMEINKLVFQTFLCDLNYVLIRMRSSLNDETSSSTWMYNLQITLKQMECAIIFAKCSAMNNKIYCINAATYSFVIQKTSTSTTSTSTTSTQTTDITLIMNQISTDVIGTLSTNTKEITEIFHEVEIYVSQNGKDTPINYQRSIRPSAGNTNSGSPSQPSTAGTPSTPSTSSPSTPSTSTPSIPSNGTSGPPSTGTYSPSSPNTYSPPSTSTPSTSTPSTSTPPTSTPSTSTPSTSTPTTSTPSTSTPSTSTPSTSTPSTSTPSTSTPSTSTPSIPSNSTSGPPSIGTYSPSSPSTYSPPSSDTSSTPTTSTPSTSTPSTGTPSTPSTSTPSTSPTSTPSTPSTSKPSTKSTSISSSTQITQSIEYFSSSVTEEFSTSISTIQSTQESDYTKTVSSSVESCQEQFQYNIDYLNNIVSKSEEFISQYTTSGSDEYTRALTAISIDVEEKKKILSSYLEIVIRRANDYPLDSNEYVFIQQSVTYTEYVKGFYKFFNIDFNEVYNSNYDVDSYMTNSITTFVEIHEMVVSAVKETPDDSYKAYLLWELEETATVFQQTTDSLKTYISQSQSFISQSGSSSQKAFYIEITQRMETIYAVYSAFLVKSYQYAQDSSSITIYESEYDVVETQTSVSYTEQSSSSGSTGQIQASPSSPTGSESQSEYTQTTTQETTIEITMDSDD